jgi:HNH endonuclease
MTTADILADPDQARACIAESTALRKHLRGIIEQYRLTGQVSELRMCDAEKALAGRHRYMDVPGFPGYCVRDDGTLWCCLYKRGFPRSEWRRIHGTKQKKSGYIAVWLHKNGVKKSYRLHTLILTSFVGTRPAGMEACHNNGNGSDNRLSNLRWGTRQDNTEDSIKHGAKTRGELVKQSNLTSEKVREIRSRRAAGEMLADLAIEFGVGQPAISDISLRKTWRHVE